MTYIHAPSPCTRSSCIHLVTCEPLGGRNRPSQTSISLQTIAHTTTVTSRQQTRVSGELNELFHGTENIYIYMCCISEKNISSNTVKTFLYNHAFNSHC